jgi:membrane protein required for colicin V production
MGTPMTESLNWVDWLLLAFLAASVISGFFEGFVRIVIGFMALVLGFLFASWFHGVAGGWVEPYVSSRTFAGFLGFLLIFVGMLVLGALVSWVIQKIFKIVGLTWLDRMVGGAVGVIRGVVVLGIIALLASAFFPKRIPAAVSQSQLAPYVFGMSRVLAEITPYEIRNSFEQSYQEFGILLDGLKKKPASRQYR